MNKSKISNFTNVLKNTALVFSFALALNSCEDKKQEYVPKEVEKTEDLLKAYSYVLGFEMSRVAGQVDSLKLDYDHFIAGFIAGQKNGAPIYDWKEIQKIKTDYTNLQLERSVKIAEAKTKSFDSLSSFYIDYNPKFLAENKTKPGVKELPSGLQYKVIKSNGGPKPNVTDIVTINFVATLIDGTEFQNTYMVGIPLVGDLSKMTPSWREIVQMMSKGDKIQAWFPPNLAFGATGIPGMVPPNAIVIIEFLLEDFGDGGMIQEQGGPGPGGQMMPPPPPPQSGGR